MLAAPLVSMDSVASTVMDPSTTSPCPRGRVPSAVGTLSSSQLSPSACVQQDT